MKLLSVQSCVSGLAGKPVVITDRIYRSAPTNPIKTSHHVWIRSATAGDEAVVGIVPPSLAVVPQQMPPPLAKILVYQNQTTTDRIEPEPPTLRIADLTRMPGRTSFS